MAFAKVLQGDKITPRTGTVIWEPSEASQKGVKQVLQGYKETPRTGTVIWELSGAVTL